MAFSIKQWVDRAAQYPLRRQLTKIAEGTDANDNPVYTMDVVRAEGQITTEGDPFNATTMNNLEQRIKQGIDSCLEKVTTMPTAGADNLGMVVKYVGETTATYTKGYDYQCQAVGTSEDYEWVHVGATEIPVDTDFNTTSNNPVKNRTITNGIDGTIIPVETSLTTASRTYSQGSHFMWKGKRYKSNGISANETLVDGGNAVEDTNIQNQLDTIDSQMNEVHHMIAPVESSSTASRSYDTGDELIWNGMLWEVIDDITSGDTLERNVNVKLSDSVEEQIANLNSALNQIKFTRDSVSITSDSAGKGSANIVTTAKQLPIITEIANNKGSSFIPTHNCKRVSDTQWTVSLGESSASNWVFTVNYSLITFP